MGFYERKYTAILPTGEIMECDNFKVIYQACRYRIRGGDDATCAIICRNTDKTFVCGMFYQNKMVITRRESWAVVPLLQLAFQKYEDTRSLWRMLTSEYLADIMNN